MWRPGIESSSSDDWVAATASLPIAFAQVREDPLIDRKLVQKIGRAARVLMIASGGETAALLSTLPLGRLHLVDVNESQLHLTRLKLQLLETASPQQRLRLLGYDPMPPETRERELSERLAALGLGPSSLGPGEWIAQFGADQCGRYEWLFARMRQILASRAGEIRQLFRMRDRDQQTAKVHPDTKLGAAIDAAFEEVMDLSRLVTIFGPDATANRVAPFASHFADRTRWAFGAFEAADNPFLQQIFLGGFMGQTWPWLQEPVKHELPPTNMTCSTMAEALEATSDESYDFIGLSNILDWIPASEAQSVLKNAYRCLSPGGLVVVRQLNSQIEIPAIPSGLQWQHELSQRLHRHDRSFFYRSLHVGVRP